MRDIRNAACVCVAASVTLLSPAVSPALDIEPIARGTVCPRGGIDENGRIIADVAGHLVFERSPGRQARAIPRLNRVRTPLRRWKVTIERKRKFISIENKLNVV